MARILVIDDDEVVLNAVQLTLELAGYEVRVAGNGRAGLNVFDHGGADLVITDILMPEVEGIETVRELRKRSPGLPIVTMTGGSWAAFYLDAATELGATGVLRKPFDADELLAIVKAGLATAEQAPSGGQAAPATAG